MIFSSASFLFAFLPCVAIVYYLLRSRTARNVFLTFVSLFFYAWGEPWFVLVMLLSIVINWFIALRIGAGGHKKAWLVVGLVCDLGLLAGFKYLGFLMENVNWIFHLSLPVPQIALPIGISFFTFQAISYIVDVYRGDGRVQKSLMNVCLYISFFPQLIAGPIVRYQTFDDQITTRRETLDDFCEGIRRFIVGLAKKVLLANNLAALADTALPCKPPSFRWWARGWRPPLICSSSISIFPAIRTWPSALRACLASICWKTSTCRSSRAPSRASGSAGTSRSPRGSAIICIFRWAAAGFPRGGCCSTWAWCGCSPAFGTARSGPIWSGVFSFSCCRRLSASPARASGWKSTIGHLYVFLVVMIASVVSRADSIPHALDLYRSMFGLDGSAIFDDTARMFLREYGAFLVAGVLCCLPVPKRIPDAVRGVGLAAAGFVAITYVVMGSYNPFIYFNF